MVEFGKELEEARQGVKNEWAPYYIDYGSLKKKLKQLRATYAATANQEEAASRMSIGPSPPSLMKRASSMMISFNRDALVDAVTREEVDRLEVDFGRSLDLEVEKVVLFFLEAQGEVATRLRRLRRRTNNMPMTPKEEVSRKKYLLAPHQTTTFSTTPVSSPDGEVGFGKKGFPDLDELERTIDSIGNDIVALMRFLQLNVTGLRKILKKHDKQIRDRLLASHYLSSRARVKYSSLQQLYHNEGVMAMISSLRRAYEDIENYKEGMMAAAPSPYDASLASRTFSGTDLPAMVGIHQRRKSLREKAVVFERIHYAQQQLDQAQRRTVQDYLTLSSDLLLEGAMREEEPEEEEEKRELDGITAMLNLATTFLYMTNYYIVGPSATDYAAALGGSPAISGVIIGMTPIAACVSCVLYSWWSNYNFKGPLLCCSVLLIVGNILYGLALSFGAFWMVLLGRLLIGLGGARGVNRRFIADTIPIKDRTFFSAAFVAVGALGMAFGPGCAGLLNMLDFNIGIIMVNGMTGPGWFMFVLWSILGVLTLIFWKEPTFRYNYNKKGGKDKAIGRGRSGSEIGGSSVGRPAGHSTSPPPRMASLPTDGVEHIPVNPPRAAVLNAVLTTSGHSGKGNNHNGGEKAPLLMGENKNGGGYSAKKLVQARSSTGSETEDGDESTHTHRRLRDDEMCGLPIPIVVCLGGYFVNKLVTEAVVSSAPVLTRYYFDWSVSSVGILMAVLGLLTLPINIAVGRLSLVVDDRWLMQMLTVVAGAGCLVLINTDSVFGEYTQWQYVLGVTVVFVSLQAHEGVIMAVTSKLIPSRLASGTFNSGFLATEAGTFARFVGDSAITVMGVASMVDLSNDLFLSSLVSVIVMWIATYSVYSLLEV